MDKIYVIMFSIYLGNRAENVVWSFEESEEEARIRVNKLNKQLKIDAERYNYLLDHEDLIYGDDGECLDPDMAKEFEWLDGEKYPYFQLGNDAGTFYYVEVEKEKD